jgi:hypothetical protein
MKPYMTNLVMTDEAAQRPIDHSPTSLVQVTGQEPRHGEGE